MCRRLAALALVTSMLLAGTAAAASLSPDSFGGRAVSVSGAFHARRLAALKITLAPSGDATGPRRLTVRLRSAPCPGCLGISGLLRGTITPHAKQIADAGDGYSLRLVGSLKWLGATVATGAVHGTGFIARGRETLTLTLRLGRGTITVEAVSGIVPGFTHP